MRVDLAARRARSRRCATTSRSWPAARSRSVPRRIAEDRLFALPAPEPFVARGRLGAPRRRPPGRGAPRWHGTLRRRRRSPRRSGRRSPRSRSCCSCNVEGIEVGASSSSRTLAGTEREARHRVSAGGTRLADRGWRARPRGDPALELASRAIRMRLATALRDLARRPWQPLDADGARLRLASLRAALWRLRELSDGSHDGRAEDDTSDVVVLAGGFMSGLPPLAMALAVTDLIRRPGATTILRRPRARARAARRARVGARPTAHPRRPHGRLPAAGRAARS